METMMTMGFIPVVATFAHIRHVIDEKNVEKKEVNPDFGVLASSSRAGSEQD